MKLLRQMWSIGIVLATCVTGSACTSNRNEDNSGLLGPTPPAPNALRIDVAEINGPYSFYPSPATVRSGQIVIWRNSDTVTHHIVFDDDSVDTGTLAAGTLSQPMIIGVGTWSYHCAIHPSMVGSVAVVSTATSQDDAVKRRSFLERRDARQAIRIGGSGRIDVPWIEVIRRTEAAVGRATQGCAVLRERLRGIWTTAGLMFFVLEL